MVIQANPEKPVGCQGRVFFFVMSRVPWIGFAPREGTSPRNGRGSGGNLSLGFENPGEEV